MKNLYACFTLLLLAQPLAAQTTLTFTPLAPLLDGGRYGMGYAYDQNAFYMVGGGGPLSAFNADVYRYDLAANAWAPVPASPGLTPQRFASAVLGTSAAGTGVVYVLNGAAATGAPVANGQTVDLQTGSAGASFTNPLPSSTTGVAALNGMLYAYGGQLAGGTFTNALRRYHPATNTWTTLAPMPEAKSTAGTAVNGKIYAIGGFNGVVNSARVDAYDPATNTWQALGTLPTTVSSQAMAVQGEWLWMVGDFNVQSYIAAYNTRTGQLRTFTSNLPPRRNAAAALVNNRLYVWGGNTASSNASTLSDMWSVDVSTVLASRSTAALPALHAYPNPTVAGLSTLDLPKGTLKVEVLDALGRTILTSQPTAGATTWELDLRGRSAGIYLVQVHTAQGLAGHCRIVNE